MRWILAFLLALGTSGALADANIPVVPPAVMPGVFTVATLPPASNNQARYAFVSDLGGGADMVLSDGTYWKHIRQGVVTDVPATASLALTPLVSPPVIRLTGTNITTMAANIATTNLYPGETFRVILPSGVLATLGSFGISAGGGSSLPLLGGSWADFMWNGTALVKTAGGTL